MSLRGEIRKRLFQRRITVVISGEYLLHVKVERAAFTEHCLQTPRVVVPTADSFSLGRSACLFSDYSWTNYCDNHRASSSRSSAQWPSLLRRRETQTQKAPRARLFLSEATQISYDTKGTSKVLFASLKLIVDIMF